MPSPRASPALCTPLAHVRITRSTSLGARPAAQEWLTTWSKLPPAKFLRTASAEAVSSMVSSASLHPYLPSLLPAAFDESEAASKPARLESAAEAIVELLDSGEATEAVAKKVADWATGELQALGTRPLLSLLERVLRGLGAALQMPSAPRSFHLLPTILSLLATIDSCPPATMSDGTTKVKDGDGIVAYALGCARRPP